MSAKRLCIACSREMGRYRFRCPWCDAAQRKPRGGVRVAGPGKRIGRPVGATHVTPENRKVSLQMSVRSSDRAAIWRYLDESGIEAADFIAEIAANLPPIVRENGDPNK